MPKNSDELRLALEKLTAAQLNSNTYSGRLLELERQLALKQRQMEMDRTIQELSDVMAVPRMYTPDVRMISGQASADRAMREWRVTQDRKWYDYEASLLDEFAPKKEPEINEWGEVSP